MAAESEQLKAARASGSLTNVIGALREEARTELADAGTPAREQVGLEDASIRVAAGLAGKTGAERRSIFRELRPGSTVTSEGIAKTQSTREQKLAKTQAWAQGLTQDQRDEYVVSDRFEALSDRQQELISEAFAQLEDRESEGSIDILNVDLDAEWVIVEGDDDETDEYVDPVDQAYLNDETNEPNYYGEES